MRLSVGTRWTLRYSLAMLATVVVLALIVFERVERRIQQDATLLLDLQATEVVEALERHRDDAQAFERWLDQKVEAGGTMIGLGVALYGPDGSLRLAKGFLADDPPPVTPQLLTDVEQNGFTPVELGRRYAHFLTLRAVDQGLLQVAIYGRPFTRRAEHIGRVFQIAIPIVLALTVAVGWWLTRSSLRPIAEITDSANRITASHLEEWIPTAGTGDELDRLAETLNGMMARIRGGVERSREFQTRLARELREPLLALQREIATLAEEEGLSDYGKRRMHRALEDAEVLAEAVHALLRLAWSDAGRVPGKSVAVPLPGLIGGAAAQVGTNAERRGVTLAIGELPDVSVSGDPFWLHQLLAAVLEAALAHAPNGGEVSVWAEQLEEPAACQLRLCSRAASMEDAAAVSQKPGGPGSAARLSLAREIARAHGGELLTEVREQGEVEIRLRVPV